MRCVERIELMPYVDNVAFTDVSSEQGWRELFAKMAKAPEEDVLVRFEVREIGSLGPVRLACAELIAEVPRQLAPYWEPMREPGI